LSNRIHEPVTAAKEIAFNLRRDKLMANHLETLIAQYYEWKGWFVRRNVKVGRRVKGGFTGELDVVVYDPTSGEIIHYEPSLDATTWEAREPRYARKFQSGKDFIFKEVFPWVKVRKLRHVAVFYRVPDKRRVFQGGTAMTIDEVIKMIRDDIAKCGRLGQNAVPEQFDLLRTIQLVVCGYVKPL
jgi:hypothetical protein